MNQKKFISLLSLVIFTVCFYNVSFLSYADEYSDVDPDVDPNEQTERLSVGTGPYGGLIVVYLGGRVFFPAYQKPNYHFSIEPGDYVGTVKFESFFEDLIPYIKKERFENEGLFYFKQDAIIPLSHIKYITFKLEGQLLRVPLFSSDDHSVSRHWSHILDEEGRMILKLNIRGTSLKPMGVASGNKKTDYNIIVKIYEDSNIRIKYQSRHQYTSWNDFDRSDVETKCTQVIFRGKIVSRIPNSFGSLNR